MIPKNDISKITNDLDQVEHQEPHFCCCNYVGVSVTHLIFSTSCTMCFFIDVIQEFVRPIAEQNVEETKYYKTDNWQENQQWIAEKVEKGAVQLNELGWSGPSILYPKVYQYGMNIWYCRIVSMILFCLFSFNVVAHLWTVITKSKLACITTIISNYVVLIIGFYVYLPMGTEKKLFLNELWVLNSNDPDSKFALVMALVFLLSVLIQLFLLIFTLCFYHSLYASLPDQEENVVEFVLSENRTPVSLKNSYIRPRPNHRQQSSSSKEKKRSVGSSQEQKQRSKKKTNSADAESISNTEDDSGSGTQKINVDDELQKKIDTAEKSDSMSQTISVHNSESTSSLFSN